jgi:hypothetical protein
MCQRYDVLKILKMKKIGLLRVYSGDGSGEDALHHVRLIGQPSPVPAV